MVLLTIQYAAVRLSRRLNTLTPDLKPDMFIARGYTPMGNGRTVCNMSRQHSLLSSDIHLRLICRTCRSRPGDNTR